jgi:CRP/FNR family cyclic AMP-dependent transcriptional regulator
MGDLVEITSSLVSRSPMRDVMKKNPAQSALSASLSLVSEKFAAEAVRSFLPGENVFVEGDDSREMYVVVEGEVEIVKAVRGGEVSLARLVRGDFLGEMSLLESLPRSATARAITQVRLLAIQPGGFLIKIRRDPTFAFELMQSLSKRIRLTNESLTKALATGATSAEKLSGILSGAEFTSHSESSSSDAAPVERESA